MAEGNETVRAWVRRYLTGMRPLTLSLRGADLLAAGVPPGPRIGEALRATRRARLDGRVDAAEELRYALDHRQRRILIRSRILCAALLLLATPAARADDRSTEVLRYDCVTDLARREMTLFANGTIRLRKGQIGNEWMGLAELSPDKMQAFLNRLSGEDLCGREEPREGARGGLDRAVRAAPAAPREGRPRPTASATSSPCRSTFRTSSASPTS